MTSVDMHIQNHIQKLNSVGKCVFCGDSTEDWPGPRQFLLISQSILESFNKAVTNWTRLERFEAFSMELTTSFARKCVYCAFKGTLFKVSSINKITPQLQKGMDREYKLRLDFLIYFPINAAYFRPIFLQIVLSKEMHWL